MGECADCNNPNSNHNYNLAATQPKPIGLQFFSLGGVNMGHFFWIIFGTLVIKILNFNPIFEPKNVAVGSQLTVMPEPGQNAT